MTMLSALRASFEEQDAPAVRRISELLLSAETAERRRMHVPITRGTLARLIGPKDRAKPPATGGTVRSAAHRLREVYHVFKTRFSRWTDADRAWFLDSLLSKILVAVMKVENRSTAYQIFVGSNGRGLELALGDIIKGKIVEVIDRADGSVEAERCAVEWQRLRLRFGERFDQLLKACEFSRHLPCRGYEAGDLMLQSIDQAEEDGVDPAELAADLRGWVAELSDRYAPAYTRMRAHFKARDSWGWDIALRRLSFLSWDEWAPVALEIDIVAGSDNHLRARYLHALQRACYVLDLVDCDQAGRLRKAATAVRQLRDGLDPFIGSYDIDGKTVFGALRSSNMFNDKARKALCGPLIIPEKRGPIVRLLETLMWPDRLPNACTDGADIEHILPQARRDGWEALFTEEEHEYWVHRLGNLCVLDKDANQALGTAGWPEKQAAYAQAGGTFLTAADAAGAAKWDVGAVAERHGRLVERVAAHLKI